MAVVGNEVLLRGELPEPELLAYSRASRPPCPTACRWAGRRLLPVPGAAGAVGRLRCAAAQLLPVLGRRRHRLGGAVPAPHARAGEGRRRRSKRVIVAETGWPGKGQAVGGAVPSADNAMKYFIDVQQWGRGEGIKLFYFSWFDEPWKRGEEGEVGTQWGLWDKDERVKYGMRRLARRLLPLLVRAAVRPLHIGAGQWTCSSEPPICASLLHAGQTGPTALRSLALHRTPPRSPGRTRCRPERCSIRSAATDRAVIRPVPASEVGQYRFQFAVLQGVAARKGGSVTSSAATARERKCR